MDIAIFKTYIKNILSFIQKFSSIIFFVSMGALVIVGSLMILSIILAPSDNTAQSTVNPNFDDETIQRVEELNPSAIKTPSGRTNPFDE